MSDSIDGLLAERATLRINKDLNASAAGGQQPEKRAAEEAAYTPAGGYDVPQTPEDLTPLPAPAGTRIGYQPGLLRPTAHLITPSAAPAEPLPESVQLGTVPGAIEAYAEATRRANSGALPSRPAPTNLASPSEQVRDREGHPMRSPDFAAAVDYAGRANAARLARLATGEERGLTGDPLIDTVLEAIVLPSQTAGPALAEVLKQVGTDPDRAESIGQVIALVGSITAGAPRGGGRPGPPGGPRHAAPREGRRALAHGTPAHAPPQRAPG